MKKYFVQSFCV